MPSVSTWVDHPDIDRLLLEQREVITRHQLLGLGVSASAITRATAGWQSPFAGVFVAVRPGRPLTFEQLCRVAILAAGDGARLCGTSAGHVLGLTDDVPDTVHVLTSWRRHPRGHHPQIRMVRERPGVRLPSLPRAVPLTTVEDTVLDLCDDSGERQVLTWVARSTQGRLTTPDRLLDRMTGRKRVRHRALLKGLLLDVASGVHSHLEQCWVEHVERPHGLPPLARQWRVPESGHPADGCHLETRTLLEADGRAFHSGDAVFRDNRWDAIHAAAGYATFRVDWAMCLEGAACETARRWGALLAARGWRGHLDPCPRCR